MLTKKGNEMMGVKKKAKFLKINRPKLGGPNKVRGFERKST